MVRRVLVASWGNPFGWRKAVYVVGDKGYEQRSSTVALKQAMGIGSEDILVFVSETIIGTKEVISPELMDKAIRDYSGALEDAKEKIMELEFVREAGIEPRICPGAGRFNIRPIGVTTEWVLPGSASAETAFAACVLSKVLGRLLDLGEDVEILVDVTHGINYMVSATRRAVLAAARMYSAATMRNVVVRVYNALPVTEEGQESPILVVDEEYVSPLKAASRLVYTASLTYSDAPSLVTADAEYKKTRDYAEIARMDNVLRRASLLGKRAAVSLYYGLPLALLQAAGEALVAGMGKDVLAEKVRETGESLINNVLYNVEVCMSSDRKRLVIKHRLAPVYDAVKFLYARIALLSYALGVFEEAGAGIEEANGVPLAVASIDQLRLVADKYLAPPQRILVNRELSLFSKELKDLIEGRGAGNERVTGITTTWAPEAPGKAEFDPRIMVAHAGLEKGHIQYRVRDGGLQLRYSPGSARKLGNLLSNLYREIARLVTG